MSTDASADDIIIIMNGKLIHTLNTHTVTWARNGFARNRTFPSPSAWARIGSGDCGVATSQFHDVAETTTGTTQGRRRSTLKMPLPGMRVLRNRASARPMTQLPKTPTTVKTMVKIVAWMNCGVWTIET